MNETCTVYIIYLNCTFDTRKAKIHVVMNEVDSVYALLPSTHYIAEKQMHILKGCKKEGIMETSDVYIFLFEYIHSQCILFCLIRITQ